MSTTVTVARVTDLLRAHAQELRNREIEVADRLTDLGVDSLELLSLAAHVETEFSLELSDRELHDIRTVGDLVALIEHKTLP
jgi:acyl carrier protein